MPINQTKQQGEEMAEQLIADYENVDLNSLEDMFMCAAKSVENSMLQSGAEPGTDYTILDLYKLAQPFALQLFSQNERASFNAGGA